MVTSFRALAIAAAVALIGLSCAAGPSAPDGEPADAIRASAIQAHMQYLAGDLLEGREAGTRGYDLAARYVESQFLLLGLRPGAGSGFLQDVPLQAHWLVGDGARMIVRPERGGRVLRLALGEDYIVQPSPLRQNSTISAPAVFVGYGIQAPEFGHDDYAGLDVSGRIAVAFAGYPKAFPSEEGAHYGSGREKQELAAARGAIGLIVIYTERYEAVSPWERTVNGLDAMSMAWIAPDGIPFVAAPTLQAVGTMSPKSGGVLFEGAPRSYHDVRGEAAEGAPKGFPLAVSVELTQRSRHERRTSANVVAILEGSDPALRNEHIVVVAHLDHEGLGTPVNGDPIYNGALDNAAGIAAMLEAARALASAPAAPRRSVIFLAVTAEEKGLLGSEYYALNPTVPIDSIVAAVNLDMPVILYDFTDVIAFGAQHSSLKGTVEAALGQMDLTLTPDPMPDQSIFVRSDHYRFVQRGVPSIFLTTGWNSTKGPGEGGKVFQGFLSSHYHRPTDDLMQALDYEAGARFARVNYLIVETIADADARPSWNEGNFFKNLFARGR